MMLSKEEKKEFLNTLKSIDYSLQALAKIMACDHTFGKARTHCKYCEISITNDTRVDEDVNARQRATGESGESSKG